MQLLTAQLKPPSQWKCLKPGYSKRCHDKVKKNPLVIASESILNKYK